jgi:hypothetical protein
MGDNIALNENGDIFVAGHLNLKDLMSHAKNTSLLASTGVAKITLNSAEQQFYGHRVSRYF